MMSPGIGYRGEDTSYPAPREPRPDPEEPISIELSRVEWAAIYVALDRMAVEYRSRPDLYRSYRPAREQIEAMQIKIRDEAGPLPIISGGL